MLYQVTRRSSAVVTGVTFSLFALALYAQQESSTDINAQLLACDKLIQPADRLACFNAVAQTLKEGPAAVPAVDVHDAASIVDSSGPELIPEVASRATKQSTTVPSQPSVHAVQAPAQKSAEAPVSDEVHDFGRDSMRTENRNKVNKKQEVTIQATIVRAWTHHDERFSVELDNGQIWRETSGSRISRRIKIGRTVEIKQGTLGSYRMNIEGIPMTASVRRTK